jgi:hypothetical protein
MFCRFSSFEPFLRSPFAFLRETVFIFQFSSNSQRCPDSRVTDVNKNIKKKLNILLAIYRIQAILLGNGTAAFNYSADYKYSPVRGQMQGLFVNFLSIFINEVGICLTIRLFLMCFSA